jgi:hypothetical protein
VCAWEEEASIALVGAESLPGAFVANADEAVGGGRAMTAAQRAQLVDNMLWLWRYRGLRCLVNDCRNNATKFVSPSTAIEHLLNADVTQQAEYRVPFVGGSRVPRFILVSHAWQSNTEYDPDDYIWADELAQKAAAATRSKVVAASTFTQQDVARVTRTGNFAAMPASPATIAVWSGPYGSPDVQSERLSGLIIEEAPLHEQAGSRT